MKLSLNNAESDSLKSIVVTCATGLETLLIEEIQELGVQDCEKRSGAVSCRCDLKTAYKICLWTRIGSRVLWQIATRSVATVDDLYHQAVTIPWDRYLAEDKTFRVNLDVVKHEGINSQFASFKIKDAVRDYFQKKSSARLMAVKNNANVFVHVYWEANTAHFSVDLAGAPLHQRGYRVEQGKAPLKETLAAAMLLWSQWHKETYHALLDPFCGSGTLLIEAALIKANIAPGLLRQHFALSHYKFFNSSLWESVVKEAKDAKETAQGNVSVMPLFRGYDSNADVVKAAMANVRKANLQHLIHIERSELGHIRLPKSFVNKQNGLVITNAPYGERIGSGDSIQHLYVALGRLLQPKIPQWRVGILSNQVEYIDKVGLESSPSHRVNNGPIRCYFRCAPWAAKNYPTIAQPLVVKDVELSAEQKAFVNRLKKNLKPLRKWVERENISCYRLYDADMPEFNMAIDWYDGQLHVQEYKPPKTVDENKAKQRLEWAITALVKLFDVPRSAIQIKTRSKQKGKQQYKKLNEERQYRAIHENGAWLLVNLRDYLDTGVFLDHRPVRYWIQKEAAGKRFLNLFAYTCAATVHAAIGGAKSSVSVDMSRTYLEWGRGNLQLNGFSEDCHRLVQANCMKWLEQSKDQFDLIFMDPPTFSNSKRMQGVLDVQRDHVQLVDAAMKRLEPGGKLLFSNNFKRFVLDAGLSDRYQVKDVTKASTPEDYKGSKAIHCCFEIQHIR